MSRTTRRWFGRLVAAVIGALLLELITLALNPTLSESNAPKFAASFLVGAIVGWMYELLAEVTKTSSKVLSAAESLATQLQYQDKALTMLRACPRHGEALSALIGDSLMENFQNVPYVDERTYLKRLMQAIDHADSYQGVQRQPVRWFKETDANDYFRRLREKKMRAKVRVFIIDAEDCAQMEEDLSSQEMMDYYWSQTGDVDSFWISARDFELQYPNLPVPKDFALYDGQLLIAYDATHQVLIFKLLGRESNELKVFDKLSEQLNQEAASPFIRIPSSQRTARSSGERSLLGVRTEGDQPAPVRTGQAPPPGG